MSEDPKIPINGYEKTINRFVKKRMDEIVSGRETKCLCPFIEKRYILCKVLDNT